MCIFRSSEAERLGCCTVYFDMACPTIVVVEDDSDIRESIHDVLETEGYSVRSFVNGKEALEGLKQCPKPCLILLDLMMPIMDGWQFLEARKHCGDTIIAVPVFIVSAIAEQANGRAGISGYIKKPIEVDLLLKAVESHCGAPSSRRAEA